MKVRVFNIRYDGGTVDEICTAKLPKRMTVEVDDDFDVKEEIADVVSDLTGWAVHGCEYKII
jgi:hypothetical protein